MNDQLVRSCSSLVREKSREFLAKARTARGSILSSSFWSDKLMDWSMKDEAFKVQLFRFVDAFPMLRTPEQVHEHLIDYLSQPGVTPPPGFELGVKAGGLAKGLLTKTFQVPLNANMVASRRLSRHH